MQWGALLLVGGGTGVKKNMRRIVRLRCRPCFEYLDEDVKSTLTDRHAGSHLNAPCQPLYQKETHA
jgi:hypothetical protein